MPNYVQNHLKISGDYNQVKELFYKVTESKDSFFDFNTIIEMPKIYS